MPCAYCEANDTNMSIYYYRYLHRCINNMIKKLNILLYFNIVFLNIIFIIYNYIHILYVLYTDTVLWQNIFE